VLLVVLLVVVVFLVVVVLFVVLVVVVGVVVVVVLLVVVVVVEVVVLKVVVVDFVVNLLLFRGQEISLQILLSLLPPLQSLPPLDAFCVTLLTLIWLPLPHDLEHSLHGPYSDQRQSIFPSTSLSGSTKTSFMMSDGVVVTIERALHSTVNDGSLSSHTPALLAYLHPDPRSCTQLSALLFRTPAINCPN